MPKYKIAIFIPAYKAVKTLDSAIRRIPPKLKNKVSEIYVFDDASDDNTYLAGIGYKLLNNLNNVNIYKNPKNLGYGGNQKKGYNYAIKKGYDIVVMLHGDGQYPVEKILGLIAPIENENADLVFGSRILGAPIQGGMPIWKYIGNKSLTWLENKVLHMAVSEFHSGFRAYKVSSLKQVNFNVCSNNYHFDTEILIQFNHKNFVIAEIPIPTHYGKESASPSFFYLLRYCLGILNSLKDYKLHQWGVRKHRIFD